MCQHPLLDKDSMKLAYCCQEIPVEEVKQCLKAPVVQGTQRLDNRAVKKKFFGLTEQSLKYLGQIEGSMSHKGLVEELQHSFVTPDVKHGGDSVMVWAAFAHIKVRGFASVEGPTESDWQS